MQDITPTSRPAVLRKLLGLGLLGLAAVAVSGCSAHGQYRDNDHYYHESRPQLSLEFYYYPDVDVYYDVHRHVYHYHHPHRGWIVVQQLPPHIRVDQHRRRDLRFNNDRPWTEKHPYKQQHSHPDPVRRDDRRDDRHDNRQDRRDDRQDSRRDNRQSQPVYSQANRDDRAVKRGQVPLRVDNAPRAERRDDRQAQQEQHRDGRRDNRQPQPVYSQANRDDRAVKRGQVPLRLDNAPREERQQAHNEENRQEQREKRQDRREDRGDDRQPRPAGRTGWGNRAGYLPR